MADEGFLLLWRRFFEHRYWSKKRTFSEAEAWIDMLAMASFRDREIMVDVNPIKLERGELLASVRYLAKRWNWSNGRIQRFISTAIACSEIELKTGTPNGYTYRVVNYEAYQNPRYTERDANDTGAGQRRKKGKKDVPNGTSHMDDAFEQFWTAYPKRQGSNPKRDALAAWTARLREGVAPAEIMAGLHRYTAYLTAKGSLGSEYVMQGKRFVGPAEPFREPWAPRNGPAVATVSVEDIRRCLHLGAASMGVTEGREAAFANIQAKDPALWLRVESVLPAMDLSYLVQLASGRNGFELDRAIGAQLERHG